MLSLSTTWNYPRHGSLSGAISEIAELGFGAVELRAKDAVPDLVRAGELCRQRGVKCPSVHAPLTRGPWADGDPSNGLASTEEEPRRRAVAAVLGTLPAAQAARSRVIVVHLGRVPASAASAESAGAERGAHLEAAARSLFELCRAESGITWALENRLHAHEIPDVEEVGLLLDDAAGRNVAYWHDTGHAHLIQRATGTPALAWLDRYGTRCAGMHLHDVVGEVDHLPPGAGEVDWPGVRGYASRSMIPVLEVHGRHTAAEITSGADFLRDHGFA